MKQTHPYPRAQSAFPLRINENQFLRDQTQAWSWPYFSAAEMACRHCGELYHWPDFMRRLVEARERLNTPFHILSAHRCAWHNARVGGAPKSEHLRLDIAIYNHNRRRLLAVCREAGFTGFGFYRSFLHIDRGRERHWYGSQKAKSLWQTYWD